jgi:U4/U6.U5 tri-snRNP-associated protein 1
LNTKLKGRTLGDADNDIDNTKAWLKKSKKKGKGLEAKKSGQTGATQSSVQDVYDESG